MQRSDLVPGVEVYYTGDVANHADAGTIIRRYQDRWGDFVDVQFEERGESLGLSVREFEPSIGQRFYTLADWKRKQAASVASQAAERIPLRLGN